jgi:hypothetical protein
MKVTVQVGEVAVRVTGLDMKPAQVRALLRLAALIDAGRQEAPAAEPERAPMGFAAPVLERLPDELPPEPGSE